MANSSRLSEAHDGTIKPASLSARALYASVFAIIHAERNEQEDGVWKERAGWVVIVSRDSLHRANGSYTWNNA